MDRKWMSVNRLTTEYENGVEEFIKFAVENATNRAKILCPCTKCLNANQKSVNDVRGDLFANGIDQSYTRWSLHGEKEHISSSGDTIPNANEYESDQLEELAEAVAKDFHDRSDMFENIVRDAREPLYSSVSTSFTKLSTVLKLYNLKAAHGWTDKSFTALLQILKEMLPADNVLPNSTYRAKRMLCSIGMEYERIHACPNDCILYRNEFEALDLCPNPKCLQPRYKRDSVPAKVVWYFPTIPRFRRLFSSVEEAKNLRWHKEEREQDGKLRHPADSPQWINIDHRFPEFGSDSRNLRLALSTDGMNPHSNQSTSHSTWPVLLVIYNLPPWLCMKRKYMMLSMLISGSKQPGNDIDVYLAPLIEDLQLMWESGIEVADAYGGENFCLRAMLFCTISDFPAYGNLSGYTTKGYKACPICEDDTDSQWLFHCGKSVYLGHRRLLHFKHKYRQLRKAFNGKLEERPAPKPLTGQQILAKVIDKNLILGKKGDTPPTTGWKKKSIFFNLPYWEHLYVRHCLDVMHIEKNVCDSLLGTLLNVPGKTKDGIKARKDMVRMKIRPELAAQQRGKRTYLPPACYTLSKKEKEKFCEFFSQVKVPSGFSANVKSLVNVKEAKLQGLKSHDCHVVMQEFLPIAIRGILPKHVRNTITRLCLFFKRICSKVIDLDELKSLQNGICLTLCQLEMYFPPSFFDIMVHLMVHIVREIRFCGPVYLRWMYPFERCMKVLKGYVKNRFRPEGCIVERYIVEEAVEFCAEYLSHTEAIGLPKVLNEDVTEGRGTVGFRIEGICSELLNQAHLYVLQNNDEVEPYVKEHISVIRRQNPTRKNETWIRNEHNRSFSQWLKKRVLEVCTHSPELVSPTLNRLLKGPLFDATSFTSYKINGYTFSTKMHDNNSTTQNSGVMVVADSVNIASAKDKNPVNAKLTYYGFIEKIWELDYIDFTMPVFCCKWVDVTHGVRIDELGFTLADLNRLGHKNEPFILASQARQVFFVPDPSDSKWSIVVSTKEGYQTDYTDRDNELIRTSISMSAIDTNVNEDEIYIRADHEEGLVFEKDNSLPQGSGRCKRKKQKIAKDNTLPQGSGRSKRQRQKK